MVQLQLYWTFQNVCKLALKVERQQKEARSSSSQTSIQYGSFSRSHLISLKQNSIAKSSLRAPQRGEAGGNMKQPISISNTNSHCCFKCQWYGHIASDCPKLKNHHSC